MAEEAFGSSALMRMSYTNDETSSATSSSRSWVKDDDGEGDGDVGGTRLRINTEMGCTLSRMIRGMRSKKKPFLIR